MRSNNKDGFVYDPAWKQWSRILLRGGGNHIHEVSIPITTIPNTVPGTESWEDVSRVLIHRADIRNHRVVTLSKDYIYTHELPDEVYKSMIDGMGRTLADFMIHGDILPFIDWKVHSELGDSYVPLRDCMVKKDWSFITRHRAGVGGVVEAHISAQLFALQYGIGVPEDSILIGGVYHQHGDDHFRTFGFYDITLQTVTFEVLLSSPEIDSVTRFSGRIGGSWPEDFKKYITHNQYVRIETANAVFDMIRSTVDNLAIYDKGDK